MNRYFVSINLLVVFIVAAISSPATINVPAFAASESDNDNVPYTPSGTLLLPLTPKLDVPKSAQSSSSSNTPVVTNQTPKSAGANDTNGTVEKGVSAPNVQTMAAERRG